MWSHGTSRLGHCSATSVSLLPQCFVLFYSQSVTYLKYYSKFWFPWSLLTSSLLINHISTIRQKYVWSFGKYLFAIFQVPNCYDAEAMRPVHVFNSADRRKYPKRLFYFRYRWCASRSFGIFLRNCNHRSTCWRRKPALQIGNMIELEFIYFSVVCVWVAKASSVAWWRSVMLSSVSWILSNIANAHFILIFSFSCFRFWRADKII